MRVDNDAGAGFTVVHLEADSRPGLLTALTSTLGDLGLEVVKAEVTGSGGRIKDTFHVQTAEGSQVTSADQLINIKRSVEARPAPPPCTAYPANQATPRDLPRLCPAQQDVCAWLWRWGCLCLGAVNGVGK